MSRPPSIRDTVLAYLRQQGVPMESWQIAEGAGLRARAVSSVLPVLVNQKMVEKQPINDRDFAYQAVMYKPNAEGFLEKVEFILTPSSVFGIDQDTLEKRLHGLRIMRDKLIVDYHYLLNNVISDYEHALRALTNSIDRSIDEAPLEDES